MTPERIFLPFRQQQILELAAKEKTQRGIARKLKISPKTVGTHIYQQKKETGSAGILERLKANNLTDALRIAFNQGLLKEKPQKKVSLEDLADNEKTVLELISQGKQNKEIARVLGKSLLDMQNDFYRKTLPKLHAKNRSGAALAYLRLKRIEKMGT